MRLMQHELSLGYCIYTGVKIVQLGYVPIASQNGDQRFKEVRD